MNTNILYGKAVAEEVRSKVRELAMAFSPAPALAAVRIGSDAATDHYLTGQSKAAQKLGLRFFPVVLPPDCSQNALEAELDRLSCDWGVDGIILMTPIPGTLDIHSARKHISPAKDVEGITPYAVGMLALGRPYLVAPTARAAFELARRHMGELSGVEALVIGYSDTVGKPLSLLLLNERATVSIARSKARDLPGLLERSDLVFVSLGKPAFVRGEMIKPGAVVIDVGIHEVRVKTDTGDESVALIGDVDASSMIGVAGALSPVPGGVGPVTTAFLYANLIDAATGRRGK
ncbi:MAG: bifunctional 5,10-methylenetetrahydrofolate dehydrogenase/5,10-methenyltetrahydrofolate cyclohydrolase [Candidatus Brocadiia bacterium]